VSAQRADSGASARELLPYFLNKLSNAARASVALRGAGMFAFPGCCDMTPLGAESRATVTRGENREQLFAWSFTAIRIGMGLRH
jgi:hypothetical protein